MPKTKVKIDIYKCLRPECENVAAHRGLCLSCYQAARRLVALKKTTWEALIQRGKAKDGELGRRKTSNWFLEDIT